MTPPPADVRVDLALARRLLADQHPDLLEHPLGVAAEGWDNVMFRLGTQAALRIPRREMAAKLVSHEQRWLPDLATLLPIPIPAPTRIGRSTRYFPYAWSVVPWIDGEVALHSDLDPTEAGRLGAFLAILHKIPVPDDPPPNPYRGRPLAERRDLYVPRLEGAAAALGVELTGATRLFLERAFEVPIPEPPSWIHGDLHSKNVIVARGRIASIIDWGDNCTGDPATDLAGLWIMFDPIDHAPFWDAYGTIDDELMTRAKAWAIAFGLMLHDSHHNSDPKFARAGIATITRAVTQAST